MPPFSIDVTRDTFREKVIEASKKVPVLVDFWAPWCGPCRALSPVLERLAEEFKGKFILAKLNTEEHPTVAIDYAVRGIPNVKAFVDGKIAGEFIGALPEPEVRRFLQRFLPSASDELRAKAIERLRRGDAAQALRLLDRALQEDPRNELARIDKAEVLIELKRSEEAIQVLEALSPVTQREERVARLIARARLARFGGDNLDVLKRRVEQNPADFESRLELAKALVAGRDYDTALSELLEIVKRDRNFRDGEGRKTMLSVFDLLGRDHPLVLKYRKLLASALN